MSLALAYVPQEIVPTLKEYNQKTIFPYTES